MKTNSIGYLAGKRSAVAPSAYLCAGTTRMCPSGIWIRVGMLPWPLIATEFHGVVCQTGSIITTRNEVSVHIYEASAWSTAISISSGSYSGLMMQELVQRKRKEFMTAPRIESSGKAEQYLIPQV